MIKQLLSLVLLASVAMATVSMSSPKLMTLNDGDHIALGSVAPGQQVKMIFDRGSGTNFKWNRVTLEMPAGWPKEDERDEQRDVTTLTVFFTVPLDTPESQYSFTATARNDLELRAPQEITFDIEVTEDVYQYSFDEDYIAQAGEENGLLLVVTSNSLASDELNFGSIDGLPAKWTNQTTVAIGPSEEKVVAFTVSPLGEGLYPLTLHVTRASGGEYQKEVMLRVYPSIPAKFKSFQEGFAITPMILQPFYSLLSFLGLAS